MQFNHNMHTLQKKGGESIFIIVIFTWSCFKGLSFKLKVEYLISSEILRKIYKFDIFWYIPDILIHHDKIQYMLIPLWYMWINHDTFFKESQETIIHSWKSFVDNIDVLMILYDVLYDFLILMYCLDTQTCLIYFVALYGIITIA